MSTSRIPGMKQSEAVDMIAAQIHPLMYENAALPPMTWAALRGIVASGCEQNRPCRTCVVAKSYYNMIMRVAKWHLSELARLNNAMDDGKENDRES